MANMLTRTDLLSLENYQEKREAMRRDLMAHKSIRHISLGDHVGLYFEDRLTVQYQIQEMLRIERIFDRVGIEDELKAYNPLIPTGRNLKATMMIEYPNEVERRQALVQLKGIEDCVYIGVGDGERAQLFVDEDMDRTNDDKTAAVHFLRFEFSDSQLSSIKTGAGLVVGIKHSEYQAELRLSSGATFDSLVGDFD
ncbi:MAG: DUF3501 family protein [Gammaproteobacteria bacterium]